MKKFTSKVDMVYTLLMDDILKGIYQQGDRVVISQLSEKYNVSNIPVREAIRKMSSKGLFQIKANHVIVISGYDKATMTSVYQTKGVLEGYAARMSIDYLTPQDIQNLRKKNQQFKVAYEEHNPKASAINVQFHMDMYSRNPNTELYEMIRDLWTKWQVAKALLPIELSSVKDSFEDHEKMLDLITAKAYDETEMFVREHKFKSGEELVRLLKR